MKINNKDMRFKQAKEKTMSNKIKNDRYGERFGLERVPLEDVIAGDRIRFTDSIMIVKSVDGDMVTVDNVGWGMMTYTIDGMKARKMKAYRKAVAA